MGKKDSVCFFLITLFVVGLIASAQAEPLQVWAVDPLVKVFRDDTKPETDAESLAEISRGEYASLQIVVRCDKPITALKAELNPPVLESDPKQTLTDLSVRFVGSVYVDRPDQKPAGDQLRKPPCEFPDPLLEESSLEVPANESQPIWITAAVPPSAPPGTYRGELQISGEAEGQNVTAKMPITVKVYNVIMGKPRLWTSNWFKETHPPGNEDELPLRMKFPPAGSPDYWPLMRSYARKLAQHRQNVLFISLWPLVDFRISPNGTMEADFSNFDRTVSIFEEEGVVGRIEGGHLGKRSESDTVAGGFESSFVIRIRQIENHEIVPRLVDPSSKEAEAFYSWFLPALVNHLRDKGWLDQYMQHLADEPTNANAASYQAMAKLVRKYAPGVKIIEACHSKDLAGAVDVWVPLFDFFHPDYDTYKERQQAGDELWYYTCCFPKGEYANRFIEMPLIKTRFLHWINFKYKATGYLHWGFNWWPRSESAFTYTTVDADAKRRVYYPAGDSWIVYPGKDGRILDSIRYEAMRDGIDDHELLSMLADRDPEAASRLADKHILDFDKYDTDIGTFRATRRELLTLLSGPVKK